MMRDFKKDYGGFYLSWEEVLDGLMKSYTPYTKREAYELRDELDAEEFCVDLSVFEWKGVYYIAEGTEIFRLQRYKEAARKEMEDARRDAEMLQAK